ncbi:YbjQ family protein [Sphingobacterium siyangense]|uniref:heavy metal-binding domain-containing protein n=1 Tax=Sphingobacterium siyangense TaxID=459529 RepID=UPI0020471E58|nr:YbjQ family protein [Sphingobacterium siyangense]
MIVTTTTTNSIEGRKISRFNDPLAANVVIGTTVFSAIGASYTSLFGGFEEKTLKPEIAHEMFSRRVRIVEGTNAT